MQGYLKTILLGLAAVTLVAAVYLGYVFVRDHGFTSPNPDLAELEKYEKEKDYPLLINTLFKKRDDMDTFATEVLPWLKEREDSGFAPYLYATAIYKLHQNLPEEAILYYFRAGLLARVDLLRCVDGTTENVVMKLESPFKDVEDYLETHPGTKVSAGTLALLKEEEEINRPKPDWLCPYGEKQLSKHIAYIDDDEWMKRREITRTSFKQLISERPQTREAP